VLNLLVELRGDLASERERLLGVCDRFLALPAPERLRFTLTRRLGWIGRVEQLEEVSEGLDRVLEGLAARGLDPEAVLAGLRAGAL
jgi:hypothetical protein